MALTAKLRRQSKEPWGWESRIDILDEDGKTILASKTVLDKTQLKEEDFEKTGRFEKLIKNYQDDVEEKAVAAAKAAEKIYTESEVTAILREKKYLGEAESFSEKMPVKPTTAEEARG